MTADKISLLVISSLVNAAICAGSFLFGVFATDPHMADVTMRIGFHVLNAVAVLALVAVFVPWVLTWTGRNRLAVLAAIAPAVLLCLAVLAFFTLDSWLRRTFS